MIGLSSNPIDEILLQKQKLNDNRKWNEIIGQTRQESIKRLNWWTHVVCGWDGFAFTNFLYTVAGRTEIVQLFPISCFVVHY